MTSVLKLHLKYIQVYKSLFQKFSMTFITTSEELYYQFVFLSPIHFSKLYMHYTYIYWISYFDLIVWTVVLVLKDMWTKRNLKSM